MHATSLLWLCCIISQRFFWESKANEEEQWVLIEDKTLGSVTLIMNLFMLMLRFKLKW